MAEAAQKHLDEQKVKDIIAQKDTLDEKGLNAILEEKVRTEKIAIKDVKLRTFITEDSSRDEMVAHVYDITYGVVKPTDNLVIIDDSIVRGTTLKQSILRILDRLHPKKIIIISSAPQIRYPDCYGIDMSKLKDFVAFQAMIELVKNRKLENKLDEVYAKCKAQENLPKEQLQNYLIELYALFSNDEISDQIAKIITPPEINAEVEVIFQTIENLHSACPDNLGDWYFSGNYPTPGGNKVVNKAFMNYMEGNENRSY